MMKDGMSPLLTFSQGKSHLTDDHHHRQQIPNPIYFHSDIQLWLECCKQY